MQGDADRRRNGNVLAFNIGAIFSCACGSSRRPNPSFYTGDQHNVCIGGGKQRLISENTHSCQQIQVAGRKRRRLRLSLSGFLKKSSTGFNLRKWRMIKARRWILRRIDETKKKAEEVELCKKRILMGGKCRPFNPSGLLHYDDQGILLPEDVLF